MVCMQYERYIILFAIIFLFSFFFPFFSFSRCLVTFLFVCSCLFSPSWNLYIKVTDTNTDTDTNYWVLL